MIPVLATRFSLGLNHLPLRFERWRNCVREYAGYQLGICNSIVNLPVTVTCLTHEVPVLIQDGEEMYIVPQCAIPGNTITAEDDEIEIESPTWHKPQQPQL